MILFLLCAALFGSLVEASNVIPHIPYIYPPKMTAPLTLRDPIHVGTVVWIAGLFKNNVYNQDLKIYVIAGGNGEFNDQMKAAVLEIRAYHDEDRISYGSLSKWGGEWNYATDSKNPVRDALQTNSPYEFVLEFKNQFIVVWVNGGVLSIYPYSATIHDLSEISGVHIAPNDELEIMLARQLPTSSFGSFPYFATFDPPLSKGKQYLSSLGLLHCGEYDNNDVYYVFHNGTELPKNYHFIVAYSCKEQWFAMASLKNGEQVGIQKKKYETSKLLNGIGLFLEVDAERVKLNVNGDDLMDYAHQVDIEKYPITNLNVVASAGRYSMSLLVMMDKPNSF